MLKIASNQKVKLIQETLGSMKKKIICVYL